VKEPDSV